MAERLYDSKPSKVNENMHVTFTPVSPDYRLNGLNGARQMLKTENFSALSGIVSGGEQPVWHYHDHQIKPAVAMRKDFF